jgi:hypothetical protein
MFEQRSEVVEHIHLMPCMGADAPGEDAAVLMPTEWLHAGLVFFFSWTYDISEILR